MRFLLLLIAIGFSSSLSAANCGGLNDVPCTIFQRDIVKLGSCNKGLKEDFGKNRCVAAGAQAAPLIQAQPRPGNCGRNKQPPCPVSIHYTPCEAPHQLHLASGTCLSPQDIQAEESRSRQRPAHCGRQNQLACAPSLHYTPCEAPNVLHANGYCNPKPTRPAHCGHHNQPPCGPSLDYTPCEAPLQLYVGNSRCMSPQDIQAEEGRKTQRPADCGRQNQLACAPSLHYTPCEAPNVLHANGYCNPKPTRPAHCGRQSQTPCGPSLDYTPCEAPLQLYLGSGTCWSPQDIQAEENRKRQRPANCGRKDQRPCALHEFVPSCESGLKEARDRCLTPQEAAPKPAARPEHCGRHNQPPCKFTEFFPSCESGLQEARDRCLTPQEAASKPQSVAPQLAETRSFALANRTEGNVDIFRGGQESSRQYVGTLGSGQVYTSEAAVGEEFYFSQAKRWVGAYRVGANPRRQLIELPSLKVFGVD
jgi:hypothetical protein